MKQKIITFTLHAAVWSLLLLTPLVFPPEFMVANDGETFNVSRWLMISAFVPIIAFFYMNYYVLIPRLWQRFGHWWYLLVVLLSGILLYYGYLAFRSAFLAEAFNLVSSYFPRPRFKAIGIVILFVIFWVTSSGLWLLAEWQQSSKRLRASEYKRTRAELALLKGQLNPHFLFNTLNGLYALTLSEDKRSPAAILKLSKLLDYVLSEAGQEYVSLEKDVSHLLHYIELSRLRLSPTTTVIVDIGKGFKGKQIAPLLFLPFVENAFMYGVSNAKETPINISLHLSGDIISFFCKNRIIRTDHPKGQHGIGIKNTRRRLELLYGGAHELSIHRTNDWFEVRLSVEVGKGWVADSGHLTPLKIGEDLAIVSTK